MLSEKAVLSSLTIGRPGARKKDPEVSDAVLEEKGAAKDTGAFHKELFDKNDSRVKAVTAAVSEARTYQQKVTLPWGNRGTRVLPSSLLIEYSNKMDELKQAFWSAADDFVNGVSDMMAIARARLGALYDEKDYPDIDTIRSKFRFEVDLTPLATENDFRINIGENEKKKIQDQYAKQTDEKLSAAMKDIWERLYAAVENMANRLSEPDAIFKKSLIGNLQALIAVLPSLNISNDQTLTDMANTVDQVLCGYDPKTLRKDKDQRKEAADNAKEIMTAMASHLDKDVTEPQSAFDPEPVMEPQPAMEPGPATEPEPEYAMDTNMDGFARVFGDHIDEDTEREAA